jgi:putative phage-type endonuclease
MIKIICEQKSEAWFTARLGRVTGTGCKDMMAAKTTATYKNLIADIASEIITNSGEDEEGYTNEWMQRGIDLEPEARKTYELLFDCKIEQVGFITPDEDNEYSEWIGISPDGLTNDNGMIEIKCPKKSTHMHYISSGKLPSEYKWQVMFQLYVTGLNYCDFISYYPGLKPFIVRVFPDKETFNLIENELDLLIIEVKKLIESYNKYDYER